MVDLARFRQKNILNKEVFLSLADSLMFGSHITREEAKTILYAVIGWLVCQKVKKVQLQDSYQDTIGIFEINKGSIKFKFWALK